MKLLSTIIFLGCVLATQTSEDYKVVCYYRYWSNFYAEDGRFQVDYIDPSLCTHVVYAYVAVNKCNRFRFLSPELQMPPTRGRDDLKNFQKLREKNPKAKFLMAIGGFSENDANFLKMLSSANGQQNFMFDVKNFLRIWKYDGISIDWHFPTPPTTNDVNRSEFVELLKLLREALGKNVTIAIAGSGNWSLVEHAYNVSQISEIVDFVSLLTFDYHGPDWSANKTGMVAPLYSRKYATDNLSQDSTVNYWLKKGLNRKKLLLGIPTYGRAFRLRNARDNQVGSPTVGGVSFPLTNTKGLVSFMEIIQYTHPIHGWTTKWDEEQMVPYRYEDDIWISYENQRSVELKAQYIIDKRLGGAMIHALDLDDFHGEAYPLVRTVSSKLLSGDEAATSHPETTTTIEKPTTNPSVPSVFECRGNGHFMDLQDCKKYYVCQYVAQGDIFLKYHLSCPTDAELFFSEETCRCDWEINSQDCLNPPLGVTQTQGCNRW